MSSIRKADATPEEWKIYREYRRAYRVQYIQKHPERYHQLEYAARTRYRQRTMEKNAGRPKPTICEACGRAGRIVWDHDAKTNQFRGWICTNCNIALGHVHDKVETLRRLIVYLARKNDNPVASTAALNFTGRKENAKRRNNRKRG
jgi:hypothetical protein